MAKQHYSRRAAECLKYAKATHNEQERELMLIRANLLQRLADEREMKAGEAPKELAPQI
jgi:hypothetical protein